MLLLNCHSWFSKSERKKLSHLYINKRINTTDQRKLKSKSKIIHTSIMFLNSEDLKMESGMYKSSEKESFVICISSSVVISACQTLDLFNSNFHSWIIHTLCNWIHFTDVDFTFVFDKITDCNITVGKYRGYINIFVISTV